MLNINKSIQINGQSFIEEKQVIYMSANITTEGNQAATITKTITDQNLYSENLKDCRADIKAFEAEVYKIEDEVLGGKK